MEHSKQPAVVFTNPVPFSTPRAMQIIVPVRWGDMDAYGHVNNTVYFRYIEQCRMDWFAFMGIRTEMNVNEVPVLVGTDCRFIKAIEYPADVRVTQLVTNVSDKVLSLTHELWVEDRLCATGNSALVWMSRSANKAIMLPAEIRARLIADA
jgi:acyl-CoA thioester hydrolase